ncbi:MAG: tetratricopeptide repeat protein [Deltaproteobacteria bacterium]|nr:tetratricopeptide repeat protein [Deltaproteobacteria bacterium]
MNRKGLHCAKYGDYRAAIRNYTQAISLCSSYKTPYYYCTVAYMRLGDYEDALNIISVLIDSCPPMAFLYEMRGNIYFCLEKYINAIEDYNRAIRTNPDLASAYYGRGVAYAETGDSKKAVADIIKSSNMGHPDAWLLTVEMRKKRKEQAALTGKE